MHSAHLKAAVIGLGVGEQHAHAYLEHPDTELTAIVELNEERARAFQQEHPHVEIMSFEQVLDSDIDIVSTASYDDMHAGEVVQCIEAGKHIFVEKPLCTKVEELERIVTIWSKKPVALSSNLVLRGAELYVWLLEKIEQRDLGEIYAIDADYLYGRIHKITEGWRKDIDSYSVMEGGGIHMIDLMLAVAGEKPDHVFSRANKIVTKDTGFRAHDFHSAEFTFPSGIIGRVTANFGCVHPHQHVLRVFGTKGTFIFDDQGARVHWGRDNSPQVEYLDIPSRPVSKGVLIPDFIACVKSGEFGAAAQREFDLMRVALAADQALAYNEPLKIEYM